jgi:hypothetical protein
VLTILTPVIHPVFLTSFFGGPSSCYKQKVFFNKDIITFVWLITLL